MMYIPLLNLIMNSSNRVTRRNAVTNPPVTPPTMAATGTGSEGWPFEVVSTIMIRILLH